MTNFLNNFWTLLLILSLGAGCGEEKSGPKIDPELETHVAGFITTLRENGVNMPFNNYKEMESVEISEASDSSDYGICIIELNENRLADTVVVDSAISRRVLIYKKKITADFPGNYKQMLRLVVYHELIHCLLEKEHDHSTDGIMATNVSDLLYLYPFSLDNLIAKSLTPAYLTTLEKIGN